MQRILFSLLLSFIALSSIAQTVSKTYTAGSSVSVDGCGTYCSSLPGITFSNSDFTVANPVISDVNISITWAKTDGTCSSPGIENSFHEQTSFRLDAPSGTQVVLAPNNTWAGGASISAVTTVFNNSASTIPSGTPVSGSFLPNTGNLDNFNSSPVAGDWFLRAGDTGFQDPLCIVSYSITLTAVESLVSSASVTSVLNCNGDNDGQVTASATGGTNPYTYAWNTGGTAALETGLGAGTYSVTITDQNGITDSTSVTLTQPVALTASAAVSSSLDCNGDTDGQVTASATGGTSPYTYAWNTGGTAALETNLGAGTYSVTITDQNGCTDSASVTMTQPTNLIASAAVTSALDCGGDTDGQVTASATGGTTSYTYAWNTGGTAALETGLGAGTYSVTITDQNGCTDSASVTMTQPTNLVSSAAVTSTLDCGGDTDGQVTASQTGGTSPYTYAWNTGGTSALETGLGAGTYSVTITDQNGCTDSASVTMTQPSALVSSATLNSNATCGGSDGAATASASGGTSSYTYSWSNGATTAGLTGLIGGTYSVTITDQNGCTDSSSVVVGNTAGVIASAAVSSALDCNGDIDGQINASPSGGSSPYTYAWNTGGTSALETGLGAGTYSVTITDQSGCTDSASVTLNQPSALVASSAVSSALNCNGDTDGQVTASAAGGTTSYTYAWNTGGTAALETGLSAGTYSVTITDQNGCTDSASVTLTQPTNLVASSAVTSTLDCSGDTDGQVTASATGGTTSYTYTWNTGGTAALETGLGAGTYSVTVTDQNGCTDSASVNLTQPTTLVASASVSSALACNGDTDGQITASAAGGTNPYTYSWNTGGTAALETGLGAGTYSVTVTDQNGCTDSASVNLTQPNPINTSFNYSAAAYCADASDPTPTITGISGGTFSSSAGLSINSSTGTIDLSASTTGLYSVTYNNTIGGCSNSSSQNVTINSVPSISTNSPVSSCVSSTATLTATTANTGQSFQFSDPSFINLGTGFVSGNSSTINVSVPSTPGSYSYSIEITNPSTGCFATSPIIVNAAAPDTAAFSYSSTSYCSSGSNPTPTIFYTLGGIFSSSTGLTIDPSTGEIDLSTSISDTYAVKYKTTGSCPDSSTVNITINSVSALAQLDSDASCFGFFDGNATALASGGTSPYTYSWSNSATTASITGIGAATYTVTITDAGGCTDTVSIAISEPSALVTSASISSALNCNGDSDGQVTASATGGTTGYTYTWNTGGTVALETGLGAGTYSVTITDQNGCTDSASVTLTEPAALVSSTALDSNVSCNSFADGGATASAAGGTTSYTYTWSNGATTSSITGIVAGTYSVTITDANGCTDSSAVTVTEPAALVASSALDANESCGGASDGAATGSATGGTGAYTYSWSNSATTASITGVVAGTYSVTITDANGCTDSASVVISQPPVLTAITAVDNTISCNGFSDGGATASATGGTGAYTYSWSNSATTASITGVIAGTFTVTITDAGGCTDTESVTITEPAALVTSAAISSALNCNGDADGQATASAVGGTAPYTYTWSNGATPATATSLSAGTYSVTITDQNGCTDSASVTLTQPTVLLASSSVTSTLDCNGDFDGQVTASATGGTASYTYAWNTGGTAALETGLAAGTYSVTVTDQNGCTDSASVTLTQPTALVASSTLNANESCVGASDGAASASASGGTGAYTYSWSNAATTASITGVVAGTYSVTLTDANGCTDSASVVISQPPVLTAITAVDNTISCNGFSDGGATASATGGTGAYTYSWSNSATTASITGIIAGTYSITITDAGGCTDTESVNITEPAALVATAITDSTVSCFNGIDGGATASAVGGTIPYTYVWSNSATTASITGLIAGTYTATITDANGCISSSSTTITEPAVLDGTTQVDSNVSCNGFSDGGASVLASGGTAPYTYAWSNGANASVITGLVAGTYTLTLSDANGCFDIDVVTITEPTALSLSLAIIEEEECIGGNDGIVNSTVTGGTTPYTYSWSNGSLTASITNATSGANGLTVSDANGCLITSSVNVISVDTTLPTIATQNLTIYLDGSGNASILTAQVDNGTTDDCQLDTLWLSQYSFDCADSNNNLIWFYAMDDFGNIDSVNVTITVLDTVSPVIVCGSPIAANNDLGVCGAMVTFSTPTATDNCTGTVSVSQIAGLLSGSTFPIGITTNRFVAIDSSGNADTCEFDVTITDSELPTITCIADISVNNDADECGAIVNFAAPATADNCGIDTTYQTAGLPSGSLFPIGLTLISFETVDSNGNINNCSFNITVTDTQAPVIVCQNDTAVCDPTFVFSLPSASDNCEVDTVIQISGIESGQPYPVGITTNTFVAVDIYGNEDTCSFNVTRDEEVAGVFAGNDETICNLTDYQLTADVPTIGNGVWLTFGPNVTSPNDPTSNITDLLFGDNTFFWSVSNGTCPAVTDTVIISVDRLPTIADAGEDMQLCDVFELDLDANNPTVGTGVWTQLNDGTVDDTLDNQTSINNLPFGEHGFVWTISNGVCPDDADTVLIYVDPNPVITASNNETVFSEVEVEIVAKSDIEVSYTWSPSTYLDDNTISNPISTPSESITYSVEGVSEAGCVGNDTLMITMFLAEDLYTGFSPNGDNINDTWTVPGIENYPDAQVSIYNRGGALIYEGTSADPPFDGKFNGQPLPIGSYYYLVELNDGSSDPLNGIVTILY